MSIKQERFAPELILKATPPRLPKGALSRPRLSIACPELADKSVILVNAQAGFGKTSLLGQWRREWLSEGAIVAWVTLDDQDDCARFAQALTVTLHMSSGRSGLRLPAQHLFLPAGDDLEQITQWLAEVIAMAVPTVLILDEAHCLPDATVTQCLTYLLRNAPANLKIVIASRKRLALPVSELTAQGYLGTVDSERLRFLFQETLEVLGARFGARIDTDSCARLHDITEGWPLGLQLVIASIEQASRLKVAIDALTKHPDNFEQFFVDTLIAQMPVRLSDALVRVAPLESLHPKLCATILGEPEAEALLDYLKTGTPILNEISDGTWARIHPLAREFLLSRFTQIPEQEQQKIHGHAATWLADHGMLEEAGKHALLAGNNDLAFDMAELCLHTTMVMGRLPLVLEWLDHLPAKEIEGRPRLRLALGWALSISERHEEGITMVAPLLNNPASDPHVMLEAQMIAAGAHFFADRIDVFAQFIKDAVLPAGEADDITGAYHNLTGLSALHEGAPDKARDILRAATPKMDELFDTVWGFRRYIIAYSYLWEGKYALAEDLLRESLAQAEISMGRRSPVAGMLATGLAALLCEREIPGEAETLLANRMDIIERFSPPEIIAISAIIAARIAVQGGNEGLALDHLEHLCIQGETRHLPRFTVFGLAEQIRIHAYHGRAETCAALCQRLDKLAPADVKDGNGILGTVLGLYYAMAQAHAAVAQWDLEKAGTMLDRADTLARRLRRGRETVEIKLLRALLTRHGGGDGTPLLVEAISLAQTYGLKLVLHSTHRDVTTWVEQIQQASITEAKAMWPAEPAATPSTAPGTRPPPVRTEVMASTLLTEKEQEILKFLSRHLSNKEIGRALGISEQTVKWHLKNLFAKLSAGTRKHAVDRARMLGIVTLAN